MKKFFSILGIIVVAGAIFVAGLVLGTQHDFMNTIVNSSSLSDDISKAATTLVLLRHLEAGEIAEAKGFLNIQLDGTIIGMNVVIPYCPDGDSTRSAQTILVGIAEHREKYPTKSNEMIDRTINEILTKTKQQNQ